MRRPALILSVFVGIASLIAIGGGFVLWNRAKQAEVGAWLAEARAEMQAGKLDEAAMFFDRYLTERRDDDAVRREYADLMLEKIKAGKPTGRDNASAFKLLEQVVRENPDDHWLRFQLATFQVRIMQFTSALEHLEVLRKACPPGGSLARATTPGSSAGAAISRHEIDALLADAFVKTGRFREAVDVLCGIVGFDRATRQFSGKHSAHNTASPATFQQLADLLEKEQGDDRSAGLVLSQSTIVNASDPKAWITLAGWKYMHEKDVPAALEAVKKATELAPEDPVVMSTNFQVAMYGQDLGEAAEIAARSLHLYPGQEWPYTSAATLALREGDVAGTIDLLVTGVSKAGPRPMLLQMLVDLPDEPAWNAALASRLADVDSLLAQEERFRAVLAGRRLMAQGKWLDAARALETARPLAAALPALKLAADLALTKCHERLGDSDLQLAAAQRAILENPKSTDARAALAKGLLAAGQAQAALADFRRVASSLKPEELAKRIDIWGPLVRLEHVAIDRHWPNRRSRKEIDALRASLESGIQADKMPVLEAEELAGRGYIDEAIRVLDEALHTSPDETAVATTAIALRARSKEAGTIDEFLTGLAPTVRGSGDVLIATAAACRTLPANVAERIGDMLLDGHPDDLNAAMAALESRLRPGRLEAAQDAARRVEAIAGPADSHSRYATAAMWALKERLAAARLPRSKRDEAIPVRKVLMEIELLRPNWPELHCLFAAVDLLEGKSEEAVARYRRALAARPFDPHIAETLVGLLMRSQHYVEAEQAIAGLDPAVVERMGRTAAELRLRVGKTTDALTIASQAAQAGSDDPDELLWFANLLARNGRAKDAELALGRGVSRSPERVDLWLALADQQAASQDPQTAGETIERALEAVPEASRGLLRAERERRVAGPEQAVGLFRALLQESTKDLFVLERATECFTAARLPDEARATLEAMMKIQPRGTVDEAARCWAIRRLAETMLREGTFPEAEQAITLLAENSGGVGTCTPEDTDLAARLLAQRPEPKSWRMAFDMLDALTRKQPLTAAQKVLAARLLDRVGNSRLARENLLSMALQPDMPIDGYAALVELLLGQGDSSTAVKWLAEMRAQSPDAPETIALQARMEMLRGDRPAAAAAAKRLMPGRDVTPKTAAADIATASTLEGLGFPKASDKLLSQAAAVSPEGVLARIAFLLRQKKLDEAAEAIAKARKSHDSPQLMLLDAALLEAKGQRQKAEETYRRVIAGKNVKAAQRVEATARLAICHLDRKETQQALELLDRALEDQGPHPDLLDAHALAWAAEGDLETAVQDLTDVVLAPTPVRILHVAHTLCLIGDDGNARGQLERALRIGLDPTTLRPSDRERLDYLVKRLGLQLR